MASTIQAISMRLGLKGLILRGGQKYRTDEIKALQQDISKLNRNYFHLPKEKIRTDRKLKSAILELLASYGPILWPAPDARKKDDRKWLLTAASSEAPAYTTDLVYALHRQQIERDFVLLLIEKCIIYKNNRDENGICFSSAVKRAQLETRTTSLHSRGPSTNSELTDFITDHEDLSDPPASRDRAMTEDSADGKRVDETETVPYQRMTRARARKIASSSGTRPSNCLALAFVNEEPRLSLVHLFKVPSSALRALESGRPISPRNFSTRTYGQKRPADTVLELAIADTTQSESLAACAGQEPLSPVLPPSKRICSLTNEQDNSVGALEHDSILEDDGVSSATVLGKRRVIPESETNSVEAVGGGHSALPGQAQPFNAEPEPEPEPELESPRMPPSKTRLRTFATDRDQQATNAVTSASGTGEHSLAEPQTNRAILGEEQPAIPILPAVSDIVEMLPPQPHFPYRLPVTEVDDFWRVPYPQYPDGYGFPTLIQDFRILQPEKNVITIDDDEPETVIKHEDPENSTGRGWQRTPKDLRHTSMIEEPFHSHRLAPSTTNEQIDRREPDALPEVAPHQVQHIETSQTDLQKRLAKTTLALQSSSSKKRIHESLKACKTSEDVMQDLRKYTVRIGPEAMVDAERLFVVLHERSSNGEKVERYNYEISLNEDLSDAWDYVMEGLLEGEFTGVEKYYLRVTIMKEGEK